MSEPQTQPPDAPSPRKGRRWPRWLIAILLAPVLAICAGLLLLDTSPGHRFIANQIEGYSTQSGLNVRVGRIDGSIYSALVLRDLSVRDGRGEFLTVPETRLDWRPFNWFTIGLDIRSVALERGSLLRLPELRETDSDAPLLPDFDIRIQQLSISDFSIAEEISGTALLASLDGEADIRGGRATVRAEGSTRRAGRLEEGDVPLDQIVLTLDARPDADRLDIEANIVAPNGGLIARLAGVQDSLTVDLAGEGSWTQWDGRLIAGGGEELAAALQISARQGEVTLLGQLFPAVLYGPDAAALGETISLQARGSLDSGTLAGQAMAASSVAVVRTDGGVDFTANRFEDLNLSVQMRDPTAFGEDVRLAGLRLDAQLLGTFGEPRLDYRLAIRALRAAGVEVDGLRSNGVAVERDGGWQTSLQLGADRLASGNAIADSLVRGVRITGAAGWRDGRIEARGLRVQGNNVDTRLTVLVEPDFSGRLEADIARAQIDVPDGGAGRVSGALTVLFGSGDWTANGRLAVAAQRVDNATVTQILGDSIRGEAVISAGSGVPFVIRDGSLSSERLAALFSGRYEPDGRIVATASGRHSQYGPFALNADGRAGDAQAQLSLDDPLPALGLEQVELALALVPDGVALTGDGQSLLGPFSGEARLYLSEVADPRITLTRLQFSQTRLQGDIYLRDSAAEGLLLLNGGGLSGTVQLQPELGGQGITAELAARNARFAGDTPIGINSGDIVVNGVIGLGEGAPPTTIQASVDVQGLSRGRLFLGGVTANADLVNGEGVITAALSGRRGSQFNLDTRTELGDGRISVSANGRYGRRRIATSQPVVLTRRDDGGWNIASALVQLGQGRARIDGQFGGDTTAFNMELAQVPLGLLDVAYADLGIGGALSGRFSYEASGLGRPTGSGQLTISSLTRSGVVLSSRPIDVALNLALTGDALAARGIIRDGDDELGRAQLRIANLPPGSDIVSRLTRGSLFGQIRYDGPSESLWRLIRVEQFDISGPVSVAADLSGTVNNPRFNGTLRTRNARLESPLSGTVITDIAADGRLAGTQLRLTSFSGSTAGDGRVSGSGTINIAGPEGVALDINARAENALLVNRDDFGARMTGDLRALSDGNGGTLSGDVEITEGRFALGVAEAINELPNIAYREVNRRADEAPRYVPFQPWRYNVSARARNRLAVTGLGLDSEWGADLQLTGLLNQPRLQGTARLVRGEYEFAGRRFALERGLISFRNNSPPDPALDIEAFAAAEGIAATINVRGTGLAPEISFSSVPALPEDELLARLLFGASIAEISAAEAVQLAAALASLRSDGAGGLDPINALRNAVGLDRLRIVSADAATGQQTGIGAGIYIGDRTFVEVITDGRGYSATQVEFQITRWLSILSTISTLGRQSANVRISRDY